MSKTEYRSGSHLYDTLWMGGGISISNGDLTVCHSNNCNRMELKYRSAILNRAQLMEFMACTLHVVVYYNQKTVNGRLNFDSPYYRIYCPHTKHGHKKKERGYLLEGRGHTVPRAEGIETLRAHAPWPCCGRFTIEDCQFVTSLEEKWKAIGNRRLGRNMGPIVRSAF